VGELRRCHLHRSLDLIGIRKALPSERITAEEAPPAFLEVEPTRSFGNEDVLELRAAAQRVISLPSRTRKAPYTQTFSSPRLSSKGAFMRCPWEDQPGAGAKVRGITGPSSSVQMVVDPAGGWVEWVTTAVRIADNVFVIAPPPTLGLAPARPRAGKSPRGPSPSTALPSRSTSTSSSVIIATVIIVVTPLPRFILMGLKIFATLPTYWQSHLAVHSAYPDKR
jgi:hypothetical protein